MHRLLTAILAASFLLTPVSCGDFFFGGAIRPGTQAVSGLVTIGQFTASTGGGVSITIITLVSNGAASALSFCDDQRGLFPVDQQVQVKFQPGAPCATVIAVALG